ncbi:hypothetical protein [Burkholderia sp. ISTR5]|uniref:hypothetical protein n=1 Tax=Burkholderia sp. ISTR5 TaxID=2500161 RepID=UPI000F0B0CB0|nr:MULTISPECIES: hypothetical protein [Burkholderia]AYQ92121.1 hypothetical protein EDD84_33305 [Burkholderia gladioli]NBI44573.1 hypothetical protein [Burkholderia sp. ISTR5]
MSRIDFRCLVLLILLVPIGLLSMAGCVSSTGGPAQGSGGEYRERQGMPNQQVDYAGHRCGSPYAYVKIHPCVFPRP